ncbi:EAL domain-containing protein (plasmid) [Rhizobium sp. WL3]|nr:EAL domain-containing protein [Rhizobium sp. WL3]
MMPTPKHSEGRHMLIGLQNLILKMIAQGDSLDETLIRLCLEVERLLPSAYASILTVDDSDCLHPAAAPSLPATFAAAFDGLKIGPAVGACGSAAFLQKAVAVLDIEHDPRWVSFPSSDLPMGVRACFSTPISGSKGRVLGTFALYFPECRGPTPLEQSIVEGCIPLAMIALERNDRVLERQRLAFTDVLTGLPNRAKFNEVLSTLHEDGVWSLVLIDLDDLKTVNDTFGHTAGDEAIFMTASRLAAATASHQAFRLGGDEYAVLVDTTDPLTLELVANDILSQVNQPATCDGHLVFLTVTIGMAQCARGVSTSQVRRNADIALYHAKETRRGGHVIFDATIASAMSRRSKAIELVAAALKDNRIEAWYQPIVRLDTEEIVGVEALARLRSPDGTIIPAAQFHEATTDFRVASALTRQMIRQVAADVGQWLRQGIPFQHVGINLSAADLACSDLPDSLLEAFESEGVSPSHAILEVTESVYLGGRDQKVQKRIASLRDAGLKIALDDFGTGFASLTHLLTVPVDVIKIDKSFVDRLGPGDVGRLVVEGLLHIAQGLGVKVVAEGIETKEQAEFLLTQGCRLGQGYHFFKAVSPEAMPQLLMSRGQKDLKMDDLRATLQSLRDSEVNVEGKKRSV